MLASPARPLRLGFSGIFLSLLLLAPTFPAEAEGSDGEAFLEAARKGNLEKIQALLKKGVDVDTRSEYGATALSFAADKGHLDIVSLLLEKGATPDVRDTFYRATPMTWALSRGHLDIAAVLVEKGAPVDDRLFMTGIQKGHRRLVAVALEKRKFDAPTLSRALLAAREAGHAEIADLLVKAGATAPDAGGGQVSEDLLAEYAGTFRNAQLGIEITFRPEKGKLKGLVPGQPEITYGPKDDRTFESLEFPGITIVFEREDDRVHRITLKQGGASFPFDRVVKAPASAAVESPPAGPEDTTPVTRPEPWPSFRGKQASGVADGQHPPIRFDGATGHNLRWKTPIPGLGHSCPVVMKGRVLLTTAISGDPETAFRHGQFGDVDSVPDNTVHEWKIYSLDASTGNVVWEKTAHKGVPKIRRHIKGSHASCTPATDGKRIVINLAGEGLHCYSFDGDRLWTVDLGDLDSGWFYDPEYQWGFASSPVIHEDRVIVQADIQSDSFIAAFRLEDGKEIWRTSREEIPSWGTPTVVTSAGRVQVVTNSTGAVYGYDVKTGQEIWRLEGNSEVTVGTPIVAHGLMFFTGGYNPFQPIYAIKVGATGNLTLGEDETTNEWVAWSHRRGGTYMPTPIVYGDLLYTCSNSGILTCYRAKTGERVYRQRINDGKGGGYTASPVAADGRLYFTSEDGDVNVVEAGPEYRLITTNPVGEVCMATPAIYDGMLLVRSTGHLYGFGAPRK